MSQLRESIRATDEYQATNNQAEGQTQTPSSGGGETVADALGSVLDVEKTDAMFWTEVGQLIVLVLILRELRGGR